MLVLSRKVDEEIVAGDIRIKIVRINRHSVRFGIDAPTSVPVHRLEVFEEIVTKGPKNPT